MNDPRTNSLLLIMGEECAEIAQRCSKAIRFGLNQVQAGQELNNATRIREEFCDLWAVAEMVEEESGMQVRPQFSSNADMRAMREKIKKVDAYLRAKTLEDIAELDKRYER